MDQLLEGLVVFVHRGFGIRIIVRNGLLARRNLLLVHLARFRFKECVQFVDHFVRDLASARHDAEEVGLEQLVGACLVVRMQSGEESVRVL